jgi:hypothetical protein
MADVQVVDIVMIQIDPDIQPRERLDQNTVEALRELYQEDGPQAFPPVVLFCDADGVHWLSDGHYRVKAVEEAVGIEGPRTIRAEIREGSKRDAIFYAAEANAKHGTPLTRQEKRCVVIRLLQDDKWGQLSDSEIARHVGVSNGFVSGIHRELRNLDSQGASLHDAKMSPPRTTTYMRNGKKITQKTANIGRKKPKAKADTTTTVPAGLDVSQDEAIAHKDEEHTAEDNQEGIKTVTIQDIDDHVVAQNERTTADDAERHTDDDQEQNLETDTSTAISNLKVAWSQANSAERFSFLQWLITHEKDEIQNRAVDAISALLEHANEDMR